MKHMYAITTYSFSKILKLQIDFYVITLIPVTREIWVQ